MATGAWPTIADITSRMDGAGKQMMMAEMLSQSIVLAKYLPMREASEMFSHHFTYRTSIPAGSWRQPNQGTPYGKSTSGKGLVGLGELVDYSQVDRTLAEGSGDVAGFRESEDVAFLEGMGQTVEQAGWYGNTAANPAQYQGLSTFYNTLNTTTASNAANVIGGGGTGSSNTSFWLLGFGPRTIYGIYPRSSKAGLNMEDKGDTVPGYDSLGNRFEAYTSWFRQQIGLVPEDWRYGARLCNLDVTNAGLAGPNAPDLFALVRQMMLMFPTLTASTSGITQTDAPSEPTAGIRPVFMGNRTLRHYLDIQAMRDRNVLLSLTDSAGRPITTISGIPVEVSDQILSTEATIS